MSQSQSRNGFGDGGRAFAKREQNERPSRPWTEASEQSLGGGERGETMFADYRVPQPAWLLRSCFPGMVGGVVLLRWG